MADWPDVDLLKKKLGLEPETTDWDDHLENLMAAAIEQVQIDVGEPVEQPTESLSAAALFLAVYIGSTEGDVDMARAADANVISAARLPKYQRLLKGHRVRFGIA
jgi:hypothetical protein